MSTGFQNPLASAEGNDLAAIVSALRELARSSDSSEGPPSGVLWISRDTTLPVDLAIPAGVTLAFAPGARITLDPGVALTIEGPLDAGLEPRFVLGERSRVSLYGPLDEIDAAWWEVPDPGGAPLDGGSVGHALNALWDRYTFGLDPAPILVGGPYLLRDTLRIAPPTGAAGRFDVVVRGRAHASGDVVTFAFADVETTGGPQPLLLVDGRVVLTMEQLSFSTRRAAHLAPVNAALLLAGDHDGSRIEACYFEVIGTTGVLVGSPPAASGDLLAGAVDVLRRFTARPRLTVRRCVFRCDLGVGAGAVAGYFDPNPTAFAAAIRVDLPSATSLRVSDCQFEGSYRAAICFAGVELAVTACTFDNTAVAPVYDPLAAVDLCVGPPWYAELRLDGTNPHVTITHCLSTSPVFLFARPLFTLGDPGGAILTNVVHRPLPSDPYASGRTIDWSPRYEARSLVLQGCEFGAHVNLGGSTHVGAVVDLGTRFHLVAGRRAPFGDAPADRVVALSVPVAP